jgi:uncharacterized protein YbjT (DUF2867 family)
VVEVHKNFEVFYMSGMILVIGATGNVGSELVKKLSKAGLKTRAAVHNISKMDKMKLPNVEVVDLDYEKPDSILKAMQGVEKIFIVTHLTDKMVEYTERVIDAAKKSGIRHIVRSSAMGVDAEPGITLGKWHRECDDLLAKSKIPYTILRPNAFMQNFINFNAQTIKSENAFYMPAGKGKISYIDVRDLAEVALKVLTENGHLGKRYNLTGPKTYDHYQIAEILSKVLGRKISYVDIPSESAKQNMQQMHLPEWYINCMLELNASWKTDYGSVVDPDIEILLERAPISFEQFAKDYADAFR